IIGGSNNHIHALIAVPATACIADVVLATKTNSSRWMKRGLKTFAWQEGYGAFSVSASVLPRVAEYIRTQEEHHRKRDYKAEFIALLKKHRVPYDPRYVFG